MDFDHLAAIDWQVMPAAVKQTIWAGAATIGAAWLGRLAWHTQLVRLGQRRFWSLELLWELVLATALGFVADGIAEYFGVQGKAATALSASSHWPRAKRSSACRPCRSAFFGSSFIAAARAASALSYSPRLSWTRLRPTAAAAFVLASLANSW